MADETEQRGGIGLPLGICAVLIALLGAGSAAFGGSSSSSSPSSEAGGGRVAPVATIARRVERIRDLRFDKIPVPKTVSGAAARKEGLADLDRGFPESERRVEEEIYKLLGLLSPRDDIRDISASVYSEQVGGYYDPRTDALRIVDGGGPKDRVVEETTLAHELVHALEDQRFDLKVDDLESTGDGALAYAALVEGTATALMTEYERLHFRPEEALGSAAASAFTAPSTDSLPPFVLAQLIFPYLGGQAFVNRLYETGGDSWRLVDLAQRVRPPASTEQVLHPEAYLRVEQPERVRVPGVRRVLGPGWRRLSAETFGEWQTRELLRLGEGGSASEGAAGWGGDRYEFWRRGPMEASGCAAPCAERDALVMRWRWDSERDAREFMAVLDDALGEAVPDGASHSAVRRGLEVTVGIAGGDATARRLARL